MYLTSGHNVRVVIGEFYHRRRIFSDDEVKRLKNLAVPFMDDEKVASMVAVFVTQQETLRFAESEKAEVRKASVQDE